MAKQAATEEKLGRLHDLLATLFTKQLERYSNQIDVLDNIDPEELESEVLAELITSGFEPNPAMLSAVSKFLKDNDIMYDTEQLNQLSSLERQLADKRKNRGNVVSLDNLKVADGT